MNIFKNKSRLRLLVLWVAILTFNLESLAGDKSPFDFAMLDFSSGLQWQVGDNTNLNYVIAPQIISFRTKPTRLIRHFTEKIIVRHRINILAENIIEGAENHYFGFSFSPSLEYWFPNNDTSVFFSPGGGFGIIDSGDITGGQGQDFTFNWFLELGAKHFFNDKYGVSFSSFFQHFSNGGQTDPNPGIDAIGFNIGITRRF